MGGASGLGRAGPSRGSPGRAGTGAPPPGTARASRTGQPGCSGWQPPVGSGRQVRSRKAQPGPSFLPGPTHRGVLGAQCLLPDLQGVVEKVCGFLVLVLVPVGQRKERGSARVGSQGPAEPGTVTPFGGPFQVSPHRLSLAPPSLWPPQESPPLCWGLCHPHSLTPLCLGPRGLPDLCPLPTPTPVPHAGPRVPSPTRLPLRHSQRGLTGTPAPGC